MPARPTCADCQQPMEIGFIPDASYMVVLQTQWQPGTPEDAKFLGFKPATLMGQDVPAIQHDAKQMHPVTAYRCPECGFLKLYAMQKGS